MMFSFSLSVYFTVFGTLAAEFEVLVFACQNGDQNPNMLQDFRCDFSSNIKILVWSWKSYEERLEHFNWGGERMRFALFPKR